MKRTELIHELEAGAESKMLKGNTLWTIWKDGNGFKIACDMMFTNEEGWTSTRYYEDDTPPSLTCPKRYLDKASVINSEWRKQIESYETNSKDIKKQIRSLFKCKQKGEKVQVTLQARDGYYLNVYVLNIVSIFPGIEGRDLIEGKRYAIPYRLVKEIKIIGPNEEK